MAGESELVDPDSLRIRWVTAPEPFFYFGGTWWDPVPRDRVLTGYLDVRWDSPEGPFAMLCPADIEPDPGLVDDRRPWLATMIERDYRQALENRYFRAWEETWDV
jgi:hypothetical protein